MSCKKNNTPVIIIKISQVLDLHILKTGFPGQPELYDKDCVRRPFASQEYKHAEKISDIREKRSEVFIWWCSADNLSLAPHICWKIHFLLIPRCYQVLVYVQPDQAWEVNQAVSFSRCITSKLQLVFLSKKWKPGKDCTSTKTKINQYL